MLGFTTPQLLAAAVAAPVGAMLHELTHAATARLLGASVRTSLLNLYVDVQLERYWPLSLRGGQRKRNLRVRIINLSPGVTGVVCASAVLLAGVSLGGWWLAALVGWLFYTVSFRVEDYSLRAARGEEWWLERQDKRTRVVLTAFSLAVVGLGLWASYSVFPSYWQPAAYLVGRALHSSAAVVLVFGGLSLEEPTRAGAA